MPKNGRFTMCLSLSERRPVIRETADLYRKAIKKEKMLILDEFIKMTEHGTKECPKYYDRHYAAWLLRNYNRKVWSITPDGKRVHFVAQAVTHQRKRKAKYALLVPLLKWFWHISDFISSRRMKVFIQDTLPGIIKRNEYKRKITKREKRLLLSISASSIDRHLRVYRKKHQLKGRSHTKPGSLLKHQIPIRYHGDWPNLPGYIEADLVAHDGGNASGQFNQTLTLHDVHTTWTHLVALLNKAHRWVMKGLDNARRQLPFDMHGFDSDCGGEFINYDMVDYFKNIGVHFTHARTGRKNDNCYVEQKNCSVVRKFVGYDRLDSERSYQVLKRLYKAVNLYVNHFQATDKLIEKTRIGSRTKKIYGDLMTPYTRVLNCPEINDKVKKDLRELHESLSPVVLHNEIERCQGILFRLAQQRGNK